MPYYGDSTPYYYGGAFANHSSLMTGIPRSFHNPLSARFAPHLSTITESSLSNLRRYSPVSTVTTRVRRVIDTADIDVSTPRTLSSRDENRQRDNRLRRDRPTIKIRSQALKDNPALREHNEKHEKSVGELLVEKFLIKDKKGLEDEESRTRVYHQVSLDRENNMQDLQSMQGRITRRMTRRRSSADIQLDAKQIQREVAYAQVQAKVLDSLVAEEQAEIEDEVRRGTLIRKGIIRGSRPISSFFGDSEESVEAEDDENETVSKMKKTFKKIKKKKKMMEKASPTDEKEKKEDALEVRQSSTSSNETCNIEDAKKDESQDENKSENKSVYKIEASNSVGDFSTIWVNATSENMEKKESIEQFRESIRIPVPKKALANVKQIADVVSVPENGILEEIETKIVLPVRKPYIKDSSRNSVYLTLKTNDKEKKKVNVKDTNVSTLQKMSNGVDALTKKDLLKLRVRDTLQKVLEIGNETNEDVPFEKSSKFIKDAKEKVVSNETKVEKNKKIGKAIIDNANLSKPKDDIVKKNGRDTVLMDNNAEVKTISVDNSEKKESITAMDKSSETLKQKINDVKGKRIVEKTDESKLAHKEVDNKKEEKTKNNVDLLAIGDTKNKLGIIESDISMKNRGIPISNDTGENSAAVSLVLTPNASCLPKPSKINTDENNAVEAPELSLRVAAYLANPPKIENFEDTAASLAENTINKEETLKRIPRGKRIDVENVTGTKSNAIDSVIAKSKDGDVRATKLNAKNKDSSNITKDDLRETRDASTSKNMSSLKSMMAGGNTKEVDGTATVLSRNMPTNSTYTNKTDAAFQNTVLRKGPSLVVKQSAESIPAKSLMDVNDKSINGMEIINTPINEKMVDLLKSESTESIDFWSEIKSNEPKQMHSIDDSKVESISSSSSSSSSSSLSSSIKKQPDDKEKGSDLKISVAPSTPTYLSSNITTTTTMTTTTTTTMTATAMATMTTTTTTTTMTTATSFPEKQQRGTIAKSPFSESKLIKNKEKVTSPEAEKENKETITGEKKKIRKKADLVISIPSSSKDVSSTVKRKNPPIKQTESSDKTPSSVVSSPSTPTQSQSEFSTPISEVPFTAVPLINIVEASPISESQIQEIDEEEESPSTPTNEWTNSPIALISKWSNQDNLSNADDHEKTMTPASSNEASLVATPNDSQQASPESSKKKKKIVKKRKSSSKEISSEENKNEQKDSKGSRNETISKSRQEATSTLKPPESSSSSRLSPKNSPTQRPIDLIRMFYTTPSALLTATPRDLSKVRRAKIKRKRHQSRTPSVSSDSTGSTASTATTSSTDGSSASTCTELDDDPEHKRMASTRSNDSGFDGSPRISTPSQSLENQRNSDTPDHFPSGRITPPAINLPRFKKYAVTDFNFLKVLGKGSFGKVLLAELRGTECVYAVKCLKKDVVLEDDDVECTLIERKVLTLATRHPYLCHLFCTFQTDSHLFFVMEYLNGGDLMFHIQKSGRFPEVRARFYAAEIWSGLNFLHKKGIVYRDLKLDNVLLDFEGHIRIADFGMCKLQIFLDRTADTFCGTPDYMAPEIIKGLKYNQAVDWWSYGVLLYEMLTGQSPFSGCDEDELFWSICNERPFIPRYLSQESTDMLVTLLEKDSGKRPPAHEIAVHPFFQSLPWDRLERRQLEPPFKPALEHTLDTKYFDTAFTVERPRLTPIPEQILSSMDQGVFRGFSYTNPNATD